MAIFRAKAQKKKAEKAAKARAKALARASKRGYKKQKRKKSKSGSFWLYSETSRSRLHEFALLRKAQHLARQARRAATGLSSGGVK